MYISHVTCCRYDRQRGGIHHEVPGPEHRGRGPPRRVDLLLPAAELLLHQRPTGTIQQLQQREGPALPLAGKLIILM